MAINVYSVPISELFCHPSHSCPITFQAPPPSVCLEAFFPANPSCLHCGCLSQPSQQPAFIVTVLPQPSLPSLQPSRRPVVIAVCPFQCPSFIVVTTYQPSLLVRLRHHSRRLHHDLYHVATSFRPSTATAFIASLSSPPKQLSPLQVCLHHRNNHLNRELCLLLCTIIALLITLITPLQTVYFIILFFSDFL